MVMMSIIMLSVFYADCHNVFHDAECRYAECHSKLACLCFIDICVINFVQNGTSQASTVPLKTLRNNLFLKREGY